MPKKSKRDVKPEEARPFTREEVLLILVEGGVSPITGEQIGTAAAASEAQRLLRKP